MRGDSTKDEYQPRSLQEYIDSVEELKLSFFKSSCAKGDIRGIIGEGIILLLEGYSIRKLIKIWKESKKIENK